MAQPLYGWRYWVGALGIVLALVVLGLVMAYITGVSAGWGDNVGITLSIFMWPALLAYHIAWRLWHRSNSK